MLKKFKTLGVFIAAVGLALGACSSGQKRGERAADQAAGQKKVSKDGEVVSESSVIVEDTPPVIGERTVSEGEASVPVRKKVTRTVVEQAQIPTVNICEQKADVNRMDVDHFVALGFSREAAEKIVSEREDRGPFSSVPELAEIEGVDSGLLSQLEPELGFSGVQQQAGEAAARDKGKKKE